jgi:hypothetical protein
VSQEILKQKLFNMLDECNAQLSKYKELRSNGLSKDEVFEAMYSAKKKVILEIIELLSK